MQMDYAILDHKGILKDKKTRHASSIANKHLNIKKIHKLVVQMRGMMVQEKQYSSARKSNIKSKSENIVTLSDRFTKKQDEIMLWKAKHDELKEELRNEALRGELASKYIEILGENVAILHKEVEQWNYTVNKMIQYYKEMIHSLMPETFETKWVKNIENKGKLVWWKYFYLLTLDTSFN